MLANFFVAYRRSFILAPRSAFAALFLGVVTCSGIEAAEDVKAPTPREVLERAQRQGADKRWEECFVTLKTGLSRGAVVPGYVSLYSRCAALAGKREEGLQLLNLAAATAPSRGVKGIRSAVRNLSCAFLTAETSQTFEEGLGLLESGVFAEADSRLSPLILAEPGNVEVMLRAGQARVLSGKAEEGRELLAKARVLNPYESELVLWHGRALFLRGKHQQALDELRRARQMSGESELASTWLSEALVALGARNQRLGFFNIG